MLVCLRIQSCLTLCHPHGLYPTRLLCPWDSPGKNTGVGCPFLLRGIFLTQGPSSGLLPWRVDSLPLSYLGNPTRMSYPDAIVLEREVVSEDCVSCYIYRWCKGKLFISETFCRSRNKEKEKGEREERLEEGRKGWKCGNKQGLEDGKREWQYWTWLAVKTSSHTLFLSEPVSPHLQRELDYLLPCNTDPWDNSFHEKGFHGIKQLAGIELHVVMVGPNLK